MPLDGGFDAHTHLDAHEFDGDRTEVVARARAAGVASFILAGADHENWDRTLEIAEATGGVAVLGIHPWVAAEMDPQDLERWLTVLGSRPLAGIGEIGLDALHAPTPAHRERQRQALRAELALARERDVPVVLHCVRALPELLAVLERDGLPGAGGMVHAWSGPPELVERALALGLFISFAPLVLRERAKKACESVVRVPDERLLIETDCPYMAPPGQTRGEPAHLVEVARGVARLRRQPLEHVWATAAQNTTRLLRIERNRHGHCPWI